MNEEEKKALVEKLLAVAKNEIRIHYKLRENVIDGPVSKIGGKPLLPEGFEWPYYTGTDYLDKNPKKRPLSFLAQFNMSEIAPLDKDNMLPKSGMLSFFYELETMKWGFEPDDLNAARVYYFPEISELKPGEFPEDLPEKYQVTEFEVSCNEHISIPEYTEYKTYMCDEFPKWDVYDECSSAAGYDPDEWGEYSKFLGYADVIQSPMQEECEALSRGYRQGCPEDYAAIPEDVKLDIKEKAKDWVLLFQMGTIETDHYELMFGDCGHIYFWMKKDDLANRNFDKAWLVLQCS